MSWRIRFNVVSSIELKSDHRLRLSLNNHSWIRSKTSSNMSRHCLTMKRNLPYETTSSITLVKKKHKTSVESSSFVLVCGQNICGQLGLSAAIIERRKPQHLKIVNNSNTDENIQSIYAGGMHSCALTKTGHVYTWGCNDDGALGRITDDINDEYRPSLFVLPEEISYVCAGDTFTIALGKSGRAYMSGCFRTSEGILGLFEYKQIAQQPITVPCDQLIRQIACGADFCLLLTEHGDLYSFGNNETGQLGRDTYLPSEKTFSTWLRPSRINSFQGQRILNIWAGGHAFFALTQNSTVLHLYACGANSFGQLGNPSKKPLYSLIEIQGFPCLDHIKKISCGLQHTLILDSFGYVYGLGRSDDGRLGHHYMNDILVPRKIDNLTNICDIAAGGSVSFVINQAGEIYSFGMGDTCQTGHGNEDIFVPTLVTSKQLERRTIQQISVGAQHTLFLVDDNITIGQRTMNIF